ncbi:MAG: methyltransferase domain-containing protein [Caulobacteraceae bacterium]|nr:methyltransferase domain-containing protein [Caulobacteraceae bacterium]
MPSWDPAIYERYKTYRDRPALDLLLQVPGDLDPREIWDLGCGTGEHAAVLAARHPAAQVHGLDSSPDMLAAARRRGARVDWVLADVADFAPEVAPDLIFTNAALQWVPDHPALFPRLVGRLAEHGVLACQMPQTWPTSWHVALRELAAEPRWADRLGAISGVRPVAEPDAYYDWLAPLCGSVEIWSTTYLHVLEGEDPVVDWMMGTGLRPYLDALQDPATRAAFIDAYRDRMAELIPARADGVTLFPFPRLFIVARR